MIGAIIGDIAGSTYEYQGCKRLDMELFPNGSDFTDDSILTLATADVLLNGGSYSEAYKRYGRNFPCPMGGYGIRFWQWLTTDDSQPYGSWGNGSAMRVGPVGYALDSFDAVLEEAERSAAVTHSHPDGIRGAQATAAAIFLGRTGASKSDIQSYIAERFGYDLQRPLSAIRLQYTFDESCERTVPESIIAFLESSDYETAIRLAISLGGDADTQACITGSIAQAYYKTIPAEFVAKARSLLPKSLLAVIDQFESRFPLMR